jgi:hypothetical protein
VHLYVHAVVVAAPPGVRSGGVLTEGVYAAGVPGVEDRYVDERGIAEEAYPAAFALWLAEISGGPGAVAHLHGQVPAARLTLRFPRWPSG